jgi:hypothetical protein
MLMVKKYLFSINVIRLSRKVILLKLKKNRSQYVQHVSTRRIRNRKDIVVAILSAE